MLCRLLLSSWAAVRAPAAAVRRLSAAPAAPYVLLDGRSTEKNILSRKTFLVDYYKYLNDNNRVMLYVHHNNLGKSDTMRVRQELRLMGAKMTYLRNTLYKVFLRSEHEPDPAQKGNTRKNKRAEHPLSPLLNGPTAVISVPHCDPRAVEKVMRLLKTTNEKLFLIGARVESAVYNVDDVLAFKELPSQQELQAQLAGLLTVLGGGGLVHTLESAGTHLYLTLQQREKDM